MKHNDVIDEYINSFNKFSSWEEKLSYLISLSKNHNIPDIYKTDEYIVQGCENKVWFHPYFSEGKCYFYLDSESMIVKGLIKILTDIYNGRDPEEILSIKPNSFFESIGMRQSLTPGRQNGLWSMIRCIIIFAKNNES